jgi:hypothetical protein
VLNIFVLDAYIILCCGHRMIYNLYGLVASLFFLTFFLDISIGIGCLNLVCLKIVRIL